MSFNNLTLFPEYTLGPLLPMSFEDSTSGRHVVRNPLKVCACELTVDNWDTIGISDFLLLRFINPTKVYFLKLYPIVILVTYLIVLLTYKF